MEPAKTRASERYRGARGESYHEQVHGQQLQSEAVYRARAELARHRYFGDLGPSAKVFEFGIGIGSNLAALEVAEASGFDLSETALEVARRHGIQGFDSFEQVPDGRYDVVLLRHVLEHLPDPLATIQQVAAKLAPAGRLLVVLPVEQRPRHQRRVLVDDVNQHLFSWKLQHLANLLSLCDLEVVDFRYGWYSMQARLLWLRRLLGFRVYELAVTAAGILRRQSEMIVWARRTVDGP